MTPAIVKHCLVAVIVPDVAGGPQQMQGRIIACIRARVNAHGCSGFQRVPVGEGVPLVAHDVLDLPAGQVLRGRALVDDFDVLIGGVIADGRDGRPPEVWLRTAKGR